MKVIKPSALSLISRCFEFRQRYRIGLAIAAFVRLSEAALLPETAMWQFLAEELPPDLPLDVGIPKSRPEFLAVAKAFAPDGSTTTRIRTEITLGAVTKRLDAFGDRTFRDDRFTDPVPFSQMPLDWVHSFGGNGVADNPSGKGAGLGKTRDPVKVQNVVNPDPCPRARPMTRNAAHVACRPRTSGRHDSRAHRSERSQLLSQERRTPNCDRSWRKGARPRPPAAIPTWSCLPDPAECAVAKRCFRNPILRC